MTMSHVSAEIENAAQMMAVLAVVLGRFEVTAPAGMGTWEDLPDKLMLKFVMAVAGGVNLHFTPRALQAD